MDEELEKILKRRAPGNEEIHQIADDEMSWIDWSNLRYSRVWNDGFVDGARWAIQRMLDKNIK